MGYQGLSVDNERHFYAFEEYDRIFINNAPYRLALHARNEEGWFFELEDGSGLSKQFLHKELSRLGSSGRIRVERNHYAPAHSPVRRPSHRLTLSELPAGKAARFSKRDAYVMAFQELQAKGLIKLTDASIKENEDLLRGLAITQVTRLMGGEGVPRSNDQRLSPSPRTLRRWLSEYAKVGAVGLVDAAHRRGYHGKAMSAEEQRLLAGAALTYACSTRPTIRKVHENVKLAFDEQNAARLAAGLPPFALPNYEAVRRHIKTLDPWMVKVKREGKEAARKAFMPVTTGLELHRPLERVEIDEHTSDVICMAESAGLFSLLTEEEKIALGLDRSKIRWTLTVALCVRTRCVVGMVISRTPQADAAVKVVSMILHDKGRWASASGALSSWDMHGTPELIVTDNGSAFRAENFRNTCSDLGISLLRAPAAMPELRGPNERFFSTLNSGVISGLPGRTFENILAKGDADPEKTAALKFDDLAFILVRWIVDIYHNTPHAGLGGETPLACWRRLAKAEGVWVPPSEQELRTAFGTRLKRMLGREGITVLNMSYHSDELAEWMMAHGPRDVEVRWHPDNIGEITVYLPGRKLYVPAVLDGFSGVSAREWLSACNELKRACPEQTLWDQKAVLNALRAIRQRSSDAVRLAEMLLDDWSEARIDREAASLMQTFRKDFKSVGTPAEDGIGRPIPWSTTEGNTQALPFPEAPLPPAPPPVPAPETSPVQQAREPAPQVWKIEE